MKKLLSLLLAISLCGCCLLSGCSSSGDNGSASSDTAEESSDPTEGLAAVASTDKYRNVYQIFVHSFCDSNGDETGDLQGIISQLDYLNDGDPNSGDDLGVDAIWLTPIMPSKSYHKYDVEDYYDVDPDFGTLDDFDELISECNKRGINVILDLVLNHISSENPLFTKAVEEVKEGNLDGNAQYFEIHETSYFDSDTQVILFGNGYACEANFSQEMPEWNLNSEKTREEFKKIAEFWLDRGVAGFRLDACKYYTNKSTDGTEFLTWFVNTCKEINPDVYIVGETWSDDSDIMDLYESGIDSQFAFKFSSSTGIFISNIISQAGAATATKIMNYDAKSQESNPNEINAWFLSNHDQVRSGNTLESQGLASQKLAAAVYMLAPGNSYIYYGEEIGITSPVTTNDANYRTAMVFDSDNMPSIYVNGVGEEAEVPTGGGAKQQLEDENSLLNYYRRIIKIKNQNPEIARGRITDTQSFDDKNICAYYVEYEGSKLLVIHNFNKTEDKTLEITDDMLSNATLRADLNPNDISSHTELKDGSITLSPQSTVILKAGK